ncbi:unnamed protein product [Didymodactylos carnosus]|uniref:Large ribosomal subunit protein bL36m n=1 Tax=Didymodactylos carnosus TaxID=1234261 RepID=A0A814FSZ5_9BILA|nr:unnamed protein product [Didymodactylos carnosus]CAF3759315.1 unnamed protein product [Didymodactylos carnosus]
MMTNPSYYLRPLLQQPISSSNFLLLNQIRTYRQKDMLRRRCKDCYKVWRYGRLYIDCPKHPKHKTKTITSFEKGWEHLDWRL